VHVSLACAVAACGGSQHTTLAPAGDQHDDGAGLLARASTSLALGDPDSAPDEPRAFGASPSGGSTYGGSTYGGNLYGGDPYGGATYASWAAPQWAYNAPSRIPHYSVIAGLSGSIEGTVTWPGAPPPKITSACGLVDNPSIHVGSDRGVRGVLVYIEKVAIGRPMPYFSRPATIGGLVAKHGCALEPAAQLVMPLPASVAIHGDASRARIRVALPAGAPKLFELQEGGRALVELAPGITRIDGEDGKLGAAWVIAIDSPYYAITDDAGRFRLDELATGTYDLTIWQAPIASATPAGVISYGAPLVVHRTVKVEPGRPAKLTIPLSAALSAGLAAPLSGR
jgi:hypothetical protein